MFFSKIKINSFFSNRSNLLRWNKKLLKYEQKVFCSNQSFKLFREQTLNLFGEKLINRNK